jgi:hypothetical protein
MATGSLVRRTQAIRGISLSSTAVGLTVIGGISMAIWILFASGIPRMIAAALAAYIGLVAQ